MIQKITYTWFNIVSPSLNFFIKRSVLFWSFIFKYLYWWWTGRPGVLRFMGSQRVQQDWATELNWLMGFLGFPGGSEVKNPLAVQEPQKTQVRSLGQEDPWQRTGKPIQYSCLENPMDRGAWWATAHRSPRVRHDWSNLAHMHGFLSLSVFFLTAPRLSWHLKDAIAYEFIFSAMYLLYDMGNNLYFDIEW